MAVRNQGKESRTEGKGARHPRGGGDPSIQGDSKLSSVKKFGSIDVSKPIITLAKAFGIFLVLNIIGIFATIKTDIFSPKYRAIDRAVMSMNIPKDWEEVPVTDAEDNIKDYFGSCRWVELLPSGCIRYTRYYKARFTGDPRLVAEGIINSSSSVKFIRAYDVCGPKKEVGYGFGECGVIFTVPGKTSCTMSLPWKPVDFAESGGVTIRC